MYNKIALIDDDQNILTSVSMLLEEEGYEVFSYTDGFLGLDGIFKENVSLVVLDVKMPRIDGLEVLRKIREKSNIPVIFLTSKDNEIDELCGLRMGADDYIKKPFSPNLLIARIKTLLRRSETTEDVSYGSTSSDEIYVHGALSLNKTKHTCSFNGKILDLTVTEFFLVLSLIEHPGQVKSRDQLIDSAYGSNTYVDDRTIDSHIKRLRKKFKEVDPDFSAIETLYGVGYRYRDEK
ncbi:MAG: response regulator transcription factor [Alphaproteobacteria bacterium]|nr:response regulator transcription factor [Alphaproteobacteria bacterium]